MGNFCSGKEKAQLKSICHLQPQELCCEPLKELGIQGQDIFEGWGRFAAGEEDGQAPDTWQVEKYLFIPWTEEPGRLQSMGSLRVGHD